MKILYQELRSALAPLMKSGGFKTAKGGMLGWNRPSTGGYLSLWFQCDKWGWSERWGSRFTLQFSIAPVSCNAMIPTGRFERIGFLLEGFEALDELRIKNNSVIERLPGTINDGGKYSENGYKVDEQMAIYGRDIWLHYYSIEDVRNWVLHFEKNLLDYASLFENEIKSEQEKARVRFDQMMSEVQSTKDALEKTAIFETFIQNETDPEFRMFGENWLAALNVEKLNLKKSKSR